MSSISKRKAHRRTPCVAAQRSKPSMLSFANASRPSALAPYLCSATCAQHVRQWQWICMRRAACPCPSVCRRRERTSGHAQMTAPFRIVRMVPERRLKPIDGIAKQHEERGCPPPIHCLQMHASRIHTRGHTAPWAVVACTFMMNGGVISRLRPPVPTAASCAASATGRQTPHIGAGAAP